jgi:nucleoside-diphosphate-sugar epimerase
MRVLIVGCGYVGTPMGAELARGGHEVFGLRRGSAFDGELKAVGIRPVQADITRLTDLKALPGAFDWVVNCVASGGGDAEDYRRTYLQGTRNLLEWLSPAPPRRFVYTSSTSVYGQTDGSWVDEESPVEPAVETAQILVETERLLLEAARAKGFPASILRVAGIYGPGRGHWFRQYLRGEARIEGRGERFLNMIHRDDVGGCVIAALEKGVGGQIFNAVDDEPVSQRAFFEWLAVTLGKGMPPSVPESEGHRKRGVTHKKVSNQKLKCVLGYQFKYPTFREGYGEELKAGQNPVEKPVSAP